MEQLQETYEAGGFVFRTKKEAELAQREIEGTKYLRQNSIWRIRTQSFPYIRI